MAPVTEAFRSAALDGREVFVAGATGLVGGAIVQALLAASDSVSVVGTHRSGVGRFIQDDRLRYVRADLTTSQGCTAAVAGCDLAILAAAATGGAAQARREPWRQVTDNVVMDSLLLDALHAAGIKRIAYIGSASAYQEFAGFIREDELDWAQDPAPAYLGIGWAKRYIEKQCEFWYRTTGMEFAIIRAANVYGPYAQFNPDNSNFIAALVRKAVDHMDPFEVWGSADVTRDVIYADDFAEAVLRTLVYERPFEIFNVGSERRTTVGNVMKLALQYANHQPREFRYLGEVGTTVPFRALDCSKARTALNWSAQTSLDEGIWQTMQWWQTHKDNWTR
jgi:nucleoside-diphosphate-sugar epimerase